MYNNVPNKNGVCGNNNPLINGRMTANVMAQYCNGVSTAELARRNGS